MLIQALFLYIPRILWRLLSARAGLDIADLIEAAHSYKSVEKYTNKQKIMEYIVQNIDQYASNPRRSKPRDSIFQKLKYFGESLFCGSGIYLGNYLVTTYFFIKIVYLMNSIIQFFVMNEFLGKQFHELGVDILRYLTNTYSSESSIESVYFPKVFSFFTQKKNIKIKKLINIFLFKVVMCDFRIREFGHPNFSHRYTIQCVLPINLYNQQIFTFLWFWFLILFFANSWALCQWINRMLPKSRRRYINKRLNMLRYFKELNEHTSVIVKPRGLFGKRKPVSVEAKRQKKKFIDDYLKFDGVFILRMVSMLTSEIVGTELLHELWNKRAVYKENSPENDNYSQNVNQNSFMSYGNHIHPLEMNKNGSSAVFYDNEKYDISKNDQNFVNDEINNTEYSKQKFEPLQTVQTNLNNGNGKFDSFQKNDPLVLDSSNKAPLRKPSQNLKLRQQYSVDVTSTSSKTSYRQRLMRMKTNTADSQYMDENVDINQAVNLKMAAYPSILNQRISSGDSIRSKNKKVVFAPSTNRESSIDANLSDIDDVFGDLNVKLDT